MKMKVEIKSLGLGAFLGAAIAFSVAAASRARTAWEYKVVPEDLFESKLEKVINTSVAEGWEFVSALPTGGEHWGFAVLRREKK